MGKKYKRGLIGPWELIILEVLAIMLAVSGCGWPEADGKSVTGMRTEQSGGVEVSLGMGHSSGTEDDSLADTGQITSSDKEEGTLAGTGQVTSSDTEDDTPSGTFEVSATGAGEESSGFRNPEKLLQYYRTAEAYTEVNTEDLIYLNSEELFSIDEISDSLFNRIYGKSYKENCTVPREELRYLRILHTGADGETRVGELICNRLLATDLMDIFKELYRQKYPIGRMVLIDEYDADDQRSMEANNTSCFNFRKVSDSANLSRHATGRAIDINPLYNPYVRVKDGVTICEPRNAAEYMDRSRDFPYKIDDRDLCYQLFTEHGFEWGGNWYSSKDYQHFQK